jgi:hypothetical protein
MRHTRRTDSSAIAALRARADLVNVGPRAGRWWSRTAGGERTLEGSYGQDCEPGKPVIDGGALEQPAELGGPAVNWASRHAQRMAACPVR